MIHYTRPNYHYHKNLLPRMKYMNLLVNSTPTLHISSLYTYFETLLVMLNLRDATLTGSLIAPWPVIADANRPYNRRIEEIIW